MINLETFLNSGTLFQNFMCLRRATHHQLYWRCACIICTVHLCSYCSSSLVPHIAYTGWNMQLLQPHSYTLIHFENLENLLITTRLYVSFYQSANKGRILFNIILKNVNYLFSKTSEKVSKTPVFEILGPRFTIAFNPFLRESEDSTRCKYHSKCSR